MALNRFLSTDTSSVKVEVTNPVLKVDSSSSGTATLVSDTVAQASLANIDAKVATELTLASVDTRLGGTLIVQDSAAETSLASIDTKLTDNATETTAALSSALLSTLNTNVTNRDAFGVGNRKSAIHTPVLLQGHVETAGTTFTAIGNGWVDGNKQYIRASTSLAMSVVSTSLNDELTDTGAQVVQIVTSDRGGALTTTNVNMNGTTRVDTGVLVSAVHSMRVVQQGANGANLGVITAFQTVDVTPPDASTFSAMAVGECVAGQCVYHVDSTDSLYLSSLTGSSSAPAVVEVEQFVHDANNFITCILQRLPVNGYFHLDLSSTPLITPVSATDGVSLRVSTKAVSGTVDVGFTLNAWEA